VDPEPGEELLFIGHPSWRSTVGFYVKGFVAAVLAGTLAGIVTRTGSRSVSVGWVAIVVLAVCITVLVAGMVRRAQTRYTITTWRVTIETGIVSRELHEARLERVQNVNCHQTVLQRLLMVGTVDFDTAGSADYDFKFHGVAGPQQIVRTVGRALRGAQPTPLEL
jgi:uncharacterized membrane protein YdbT with pleckstrin-like domain